MPNRSVKIVRIADNDGTVWSGGSYIVTINKDDANYGTVDFVGYNYQGSALRKCMYDGKWQPLEWENPPMEPNKEYRTTERYEGKPVYAYHNIYTLESTFSGNAQLDILTDIRNADECIRHHAKFGYYFLPYVDGGATTAVEGLSTNTGIFTLRNTGAGSWNAGYKLKYTFYYTKTTD